ncbi:MAG: hypothetical protein EAY65_00790 [Alphaproteobacteria bacterium]|nr:MAG: hypothetical protein EAY65_00790 [Alphaproteobacteria bacterium]
MITELKYAPIGSFHEVVILETCFSLRLQRYVVDGKETFIVLHGNKADIAIFVTLGSAHGIATIKKDNGSLSTVRINGYYNGTSQIFELRTDDQDSVHLKKSIFQRFFNLVKKILIA